MDGRYHVPVLGREIVAHWLTDPRGVYLDGTLGGGGHAELVLNKLDTAAHYIGMDRDGEAIAFARQRLAAFSNITFFRGVFTQMEEAMRRAGFEALNGVLLDLGVSSKTVPVTIKLAPAFTRSWA